jgi:hypothetical protein
VVLEVPALPMGLEEGEVLDDDEGDEVYVFMSVNLTTDFPG